MAKAFASPTEQVGTPVGPRGWETMRAGVSGTLAVGMVIPPAHTARLYLASPAREYLIIECGICDGPIKVFPSQCLPSILSVIGNALTFLIIAFCPHNHSLVCK